MRVNEAREHADEADRGRRPDEALLARARNGDPSAFGTLLERIRPLVRRWALVATGDVDAAADVTQRVLLSVHRGLGDVRDGGFRAWLYRLTANAAADEHRTRRRSERLRDAMLQHHAARAEEPADVHERLDAITVRRLVHRFAEQLPARQRQVFDLVDLQGFEPAEVAQMLDIAPATVRVHLLRARRRLRELLIESTPEIEEEYG